MGIFTSIRPLRYPHIQKHFVIYAQLISGLGQVPFYFDVRFARTGQLIRTTHSHVLKQAGRIGSYHAAMPVSPVRNLSE